MIQKTKHLKITFSDEGKIISIDLNKKSPNELMDLNVNFRKALQKMKDLKFKIRGEEIEIKKTANRSYLTEAGKETSIKESEKNIEKLKEELKKASVEMAKAREMLLEYEGVVIPKKQYKNRKDGKHGNK